VENNHHLGRIMRECQINSPSAICHFWFAICHFWFAVPEPTSSSPQPSTVNSSGPALIEALAF